MRFMMLMIPRVYQPEAEKEDVALTGMPPADLVAKMMKYNEDLQKAGILLALDGLHPLSKGARVSFPGGKPQVVDGPYAEAKEVLGGYWVIQVKSKEEAVEWARRCPALEGDVIELRQVQEMTDWPDDVQEVVSQFPDLEAQFGQNKS
ncbi:MAG: YciI family protein [Alphaproteobacteria bacterium]